MQRIKIYPVHWLRLILFFLLVFLAVSLFSCKVREKIVTQYEIIDTMFFVEKTTTRYDTIQLPADSAYIEAYFQCDSLGNVLIRELNEEKGKLKVKTIYKDNTIKVLVNVDSAEIIRRAEESYQSKLTESNKRVHQSLQEKVSIIWYKYVLWGIGIGIIISIFAKIIWSYLKSKVL